MMNRIATGSRTSAHQTIVAIGLWAAASCGCAAMPDTETPATGPAPATAAAPPSAPAPLIKAALDDAASHTGLPAEQLKVLDVTAVTWPDGSLGCPEPGLMYPQMLVPGFRITIEAAEKRLDYHLSKRGAVVLCPQERAMAPVSPTGARPEGGS